MPFSRMPKSVKSGVKHKHKKHGGHRWMSAYESARKQGHTKETAAKIAYGALNKESLSLNIKNLYMNLFENDLSINKFKELSHWLGEYKLGNSIHNAPDHVKQWFSQMNWDIPRIQKFVELGLKVAQKNTTQKKISPEAAYENDLVDERKNLVDLNPEDSEKHRFKESLSLIDAYNLISEQNPPGMQGLDRPGQSQARPSVDDLGKQLQNLVAQLNKTQDPNQKAQLAAQMQQILTQIATGGLKQGI